MILKILYQNRLWYFKEMSASGSHCSSIEPESMSLGYLGVKIISKWAWWMVEVKSHHQSSCEGGKFKLKRNTQLDQTGKYIEVFISTNIWRFLSSLCIGLFLS